MKIGNVSGSALYHFVAMPLAIFVMTIEGLALVLFGSSPVGGTSWLPSFVEFVGPLVGDRSAQVILGLIFLAQSVCAALFFWRAMGHPPDREKHDL